MHTAADPTKVPPVGNPAITAAVSGHVASLDCLFVPEPPVVLEAVPKEQLVEARELKLREQALAGKPPGAQILKDRARQDHWGMVSLEVYDEGAAQVELECPWDDLECQARLAAARAKKVEEAVQAEPVQVEAAMTADPAESCRGAGGGPGTTEAKE